jgi:hypothetical protein
MCSCFVDSWCILRHNMHTLHSLSVQNMPFTASKRFDTAVETTNTGSLQHMWRLVLAGLPWTVLEGCYAEDRATLPNACRTCRQRDIMRACKCLQDGM